METGTIATHVNHETNDNINKPTATALLRQIKFVHDKTTTRSSYKNSPSRHKFNAPLSICRYKQTKQSRVLPT